MTIGKVYQWLLTKRRSKQFIKKEFDPEVLHIREEVIRRFPKVHKGIKCTHHELEPIFMADYIISHNHLEGDMVECGVFKGGSTAKLSILSKRFGKTYHIYDSFEGLSEPKDGQQIDITLSGKSQEWSKGQFYGALDEVKSNIQSFGEPDNLQYHKGFFEDSMPEFVPDKIFFAFIDVDIVEPAQTCVRFLWPKLVKGGRIFFHDVQFRKFCEGVSDEGLWQELGESPPILWGAGYGCGDMAQNVGFIEK